MKRAPESSSLSVRLAALSEPVRLRMARVLERQELTVGEVASVVQLPQSSASRHLKALATAGWVSRRADGTSTLYRLVLDELSVTDRELWLAVRGGLERDADFGQDELRLAAVLAERRTDSLSYFGRLGGAWDAVRQELFGERFTALSLLSLVPADWHVVDLGCGTGNAAELLAPVVGQVTAVDVSEAMLDAARQRLSAWRNVEVVEGVLERLPLASGSADAAVLALALHHVEEPSLVLRECARVLRSERGGGVALIVDMVAHEREEFRRSMGHKHMGFSRETVEGWCEGAGLVMARWHELPPEPETRGPALFACVARVKESQWGGRRGALASVVPGLALRSGEVNR
jgi:ArsR family transcriptional regulator